MITKQGPCKPPQLQNSIALHKLCGGTKLNLTTRRRTTATSFHMLLPTNIDNISFTTCGTKFTDRHIKFTNAKRITVNKQMVGKTVPNKTKKAVNVTDLILL